MDGADADAVLAALPSEAWSAIASAALRRAAVAAAWRIEAIPAGIGDAIAGTFRVTGTARAAGETVPWAAIAKALRPRVVAAADPAHWRAWQREALVYRSGIAAGVPGGFEPARHAGSR